jgi:hypothetical protein
MGHSIASSTLSRRNRSRLHLGLLRTGPHVSLYMGRSRGSPSSGVVTDDDSIELDRELVKD